MKFHSRQFSCRQWLLVFFFCACAFGASSVIGPSWSQVPVVAPEPPSVSPKSQAAQATFEKIAAQLEFFNLGPFLYNRAELNFRPAAAAAGPRYFALLNQVLDPQMTVAEIAPLRHHTDAKVRTLALAALFHRNEPHLLPLIMELAGDTNPTFNGYTTLSPTWLAHTGIGPPPEKQSVGDVANAMVNFYLKQAGFHSGVAGSRDAPGFSAYWAQRKERKFSASWFAVALARASRGISATQPQYRADIIALRKRIDALPTADRDWTLLYLSGATGSDFLTTEAELLAAAKRRGADALLSVLRENIPSDDPDLQRHDKYIGPYEHLMGWILARATQLLRPEMADDLLECERWQRDYEKRNAANPYITAVWPIAAARLQPQRARAILHAAWSRFNGEYDGHHRGLLMAALAQVGDTRDFAFISNWFFAPPPGKYDGTDSLGRQAGFLDHLPHQGASRATRQMVARLIQDKRFDTAKFWAIWKAAELVNAWSAAPIVDIRKLFAEGRSGDENRPEALAAFATARDTLRQTSTKWSRSKS